jgi:UDP-2,3-diacylglucosamine pyrophosphatase LpxH
MQDGEGSKAPMADEPPPEAGVTRVRTLFLSDFHLGTPGSQPDKLLEFLRRYEAETIYLVGDAIDGWRLKSHWYWPQTHNDVVQKFLRQMRKGTRIIYLPGNHDEFLRDFVGLTFGQLEVAERIRHQAADGRTYLVLHGDQFDVVVRHMPWLAHVGDGAYRFALWANGLINLFRRRMGLPYWSLSAWAKRKVKNAVNFVGRFEDILTDEARREGAEGVICGHIHHAADRDIGGIRYLNSGDWVESCTALIEDFAGDIQLIRFGEILRAEARDAIALPAPVKPRVA